MPRKQDLFHPDHQPHRRGWLPLPKGRNMRSKFIPLIVTKSHFVLADTHWNFRGQKTEQCERTTIEQWNRGHIGKHMAECQQFMPTLKQKRQKKRRRFSSSCWLAFVSFGELLIVILRLGWVGGIDDWSITSYPELEIYIKWSSKIHLRVFWLSWVRGLFCHFDFPTWNYSNNNFISSHHLERSINWLELLVQ